MERHEALPTANIHMAYQYDVPERSSWGIRVLQPDYRMRFFMSAGRQEFSQTVVKELAAMASHKLECMIADSCFFPDQEACYFFVLHAGFATNTCFHRLYLPEAVLRRKVLACLMPQKPPSVTCDDVNLYRASRVWRKAGGSLRMCILAEMRLLSSSSSLSCACKQSETFLTLP